MSNFRKSGRILSWLVVFLAVSAGYLYAFPQPNVFYAVIVALHAAGGVLATILLLVFLVSLLRNGSLSAKAGWLLIAAGAVLGVILIKTGTPRNEWNKLYFHIIISLAGVGLLLADWWGRRRRWESGTGSKVVAGVVASRALFRNACAGWLCRALHPPRLGITESHRESRPCLLKPWTGKATAARPFLSQFRAGLRQAEDSQQVLHGVGLLQALPRGHLQPVVQLGPPLLVVQQSVVSQEHRVHAGRRSAPSLRSGAADATIRPCSTAG